MTYGTKWRLKVSVSIGRFPPWLAKQRERGEVDVEEREHQQTHGDEAVEGGEVEPVVDPAVGEPGPGLLAAVEQRAAEVLGCRRVAGDDRLARARDERAAREPRRIGLRNGPDCSRVERGEPAAARVEV